MRLQWSNKVHDMKFVLKREFKREIIINPIPFWFVQKIIGKNTKKMRMRIMNIEFFMRKYKKSIQNRMTLEVFINTM